MTAHDCGKVIIRFGFKYSRARNGVDAWRMAGVGMHDITSAQARSGAAAAVCASHASRRTMSRMAIGVWAAGATAMSLGIVELCRHPSSAVHALPPNAGNMIHKREVRSGGSLFDCEKGEVDRAGQVVRGSKKSG